MRILCYGIVLILTSYYFYDVYCDSEKSVLEELGIDILDFTKEFTALIDFYVEAQEDPAAIQDSYLNITELIIKYDYPVQEHRVQTDDGYILKMIRIENKGPPVFLMHGLLMSADDWLTAGLKDSLAYQLASEGYDVWMGNARGNKHSREHVSISPETLEFWEFSWNEIGIYDLPAMIDYVINTTNKENLMYIGHSQGTTAFFVMCSEKPDYNNKISKMIALSPAAWIFRMTSPLVRMVAPFHKYHPILTHMLHIYEILPRPIKESLFTEMLFLTKTPICEIENGLACITILFIFGGFDYEQFNMVNAPAIFGHAPSGASIYQFVHYLQNMMSASFRKFDYGEHKNLEMYGSTEPPTYAVDNVTVPIALFYSGNDWLSDVQDVKQLENTLPNVIESYRVPFKKFNHFDFLWSRNVKGLINDKILQLLSLRTII
ncbi:unnamed protein product [Spodoptera littoralis]|uniref:Lipase n=1 Tax=Spodoptera littoralis TaxID=7109 RepID=A0A9P0IEN2_SPOLI|nr:unnamed protein product [Spodoptera littoralis]CAH1645431.1 unnamed protein product [Spodoptera littoralis]